MKTVLGLAAVTLLAQPAFAQDYEPRDYGADREVEYVEVLPRSGLRIEGKAYWESVSDPEEDIGVVYEFGDGFGYGVEAGFDIAAGSRLAIGPYASFQFDGASREESDVYVATKKYFSAGLHAGLATGPNSQVYAKIGYAELTTEFVVPLFDPNTNTDVLVAGEDTSEGYEIGLGYEQGFGSNLYGRVGVDIGQTSDFLETFDLQRVTLGVALGARL